MSKPFTDILRDWRKGKLVAAIDEELEEVVRSVMEHQKPGSITLQITVKCQGKGDNAIILGAKLSTTLPKQEQPEAMFFADLEGGLHRDDPTQQRMFADATEGRAKPVTEDKFDPETGELIDPETGKPHLVVRLSQAKA
jgi:hypothetical protein